MSIEVTTKGAISRITSLKIQNFRGYTGTHALNCDADFVLVVGPNGHGKTGLIDALTLLLTGYNIHDSADKLRSVYQEAGSAVSISAECMAEDGETSSLAIDIEGEIDRPFALPGEDQINPELRARLCAFYQDRVGLLFDREAKGLTLRDVLEPKPQAIIDIEEQLKPIKESLIAASQGKDLRGEWVGDTPKTLDAILVDAWRPVQEELRQIADLMGNGWTPLTEDVVTDPATAREAVERLARGWLSGMGYPAAEIPGDRLMENLIERLLTMLDGAIEEFRQLAVEASAEARDLQKKLDAAEAEQDALERKYPTLDEDLDWAGGGTGYADLDLLTLFRLLAERTEVWRTPPPGSCDELRRIADEFARVVPLEAEKCAGILAVWLDPRRQAKQRRLVLDQRIAELTRELDQARSSEAVRRLETVQYSLRQTRKSLEGAWRNRWERYRFDHEKEGRRQANDFLIAAGEAAEGVRKYLDDALPLSRPLREDLERRANTVLRRFSLVEGMIPLKLSQETRARGEDRKSLTFEPTTGDDGERGLDHFSTGQRAQVAMSLLLAQNQAVTSRLGHRVILLDDVSTAYDLSNLTRETVMWRQLAYGAEGKENTRVQRQLFLCCHHEDMINMVADLMVPPTGRTMRMLRFKGWSKKAGPDIEQMMVEPSADPAGMSGLAKALACF